MMLFVVSSQGTGRRKAVLLLSMLLIAGSVAVGYAWQQRSNRGASTNRTNVKSKDPPKNGPVDPDRAMEIVNKICDLGPRVSDTPAMKAQQDFIRDHFEKLGAKVSMQEFPARHPIKGGVTLANMIVEFNPDATERILICCHYDTRPFAMMDPDYRVHRKEGVFLGANDGASGVALLCELGRSMESIKCKYGVDFVFFDAEELIYNERTTISDGDPYCLGSEHFAREYKSRPPKHTYKWGVLVDMIGDANLQIFQEQNSFRWKDTRPLVRDIWNVAKRLGVKEFIDHTNHEVKDDHVPLHDIGGIPCIDIIDFDYPYPGAPRQYWHTLEDKPANCSGRSIALVGWVLAEWLKSVK
jgi:glutaminyl-peptide cyclotransferase